jgi:flagellin-like protein
MHREQDRGLSPVIGGVIFIAIVVVLISIWGVVIFGLTDETNPAPDTRIELEQYNDGVAHQLVFVGGENVSGDRLTLQGVANEKLFRGTEPRASDTFDIYPVEKELRLVWKGNGTTHTLHTYEVDPETLPYALQEENQRCGAAENNIEADGNFGMSGDRIVCSVTEQTDTGISDINVDIDADSTLIGSIDTDGDVDIDSSMVVGSVTTDGDDIVVTDETEIYGDVVAPSGTNIDIDGESNVSGAVVLNDGSLSLDDVVVEGHVYAKESQFSCSGGTVIGPDEESCSAYDPKDPSNY